MHPARAVAWRARRGAGDARAHKAPEYLRVARVRARRVGGVGGQDWPAGLDAQRACAECSGMGRPLCVGSGQYHFRGDLAWLPPWHMAGTSASTAPRCGVLEEFVVVPNGQRLLAPRTQRHGVQPAASFQSRRQKIQAPVSRGAPESDPPGLYKPCGGWRNCGADQRTRLLSRAPCTRVAREQRSKPGQRVGTGGALGTGSGCSRIPATTSNALWIGSLVLRNAIRLSGIVRPSCRA